jgi:DDE superfamily endonuclease
MILSLKRRLPTSSGCTSNHRCTPLYSASTRRVPSKRWIAWTRFCPFLRGRAERHGFEYYRHGTLSLYSALNTQSGEVLAKTSARHTSAEFVDFLAQIVASQPAGREIHVIADNLSAHKSKRVFDFLEANPTVRIHYTPDLL